MCPCNDIISQFLIKPKQNGIYQRHSSKCQLLLQFFQPLGNVLSDAENHQSSSYWPTVSNIKGCGDYYWLFLLDTEVVWENINIYFQFLPILSTEIVQELFDIPPEGKQCFVCPSWWTPWLLMTWWCLKPGPRFNIKMTSYQYRKSQCGEKTILRPSYLHNRISYTGKMTFLYWIRAKGISSDGIDLVLLE